MCNAQTQWWAVKDKNTGEVFHLCTDELCAINFSKGTGDESIVIPVRIVEDAGPCEWERTDMDTDCPEPDITNR